MWTVATVGRILDLDEVHFSFVRVEVADVHIRPSPCCRSLDILIVGKMSATIGPALF